MCANQNCYGAGYIDPAGIFKAGQEHVEGCKPKTSGETECFRHALIAAAISDRGRLKDVYEDVACSSK